MSHEYPTPDPRHIDCATCPARGRSCDDCVVTVLLGPPLLDEAVTTAIAVLADRGLVPPLRDPRDPRDQQEAGGQRAG